MLKHRIVKNFLDVESFSKLEESLMGDQFPWHCHNRGVSVTGDNIGWYFTHEFYSDFSIRSNWFKLIVPILNVLKPLALIRVKANLYPQTHKIIEHDSHKDYSEKHKGFILSINTNNGFTRIGKKDKVFSEANTGYYFDSSKEHNSSTCTDKTTRVNINFNYI